MEKRVNELREHPLNSKVYGTSDLSDAFLSNVAKHGVLQPLLITDADVIISGHRRLAAARKLAMDSVPVMISDITDDLEIERLVIESNEQREKTFTQKMREGEELERIERALAKRTQGQRTDLLQTSQNFLQSFAESSVKERTNESINEGVTRDIVAKKVGLGSGEQYRKAKRVWQAAEAGNALAKQYVEKLDRDETTIHAAEMAVRREEVKDKLESVPLPTGKKYKVIYADPPWKYGNTMPGYFYEQADHYMLLTPKEVTELASKIEELCEDNAVLFLWCTSPILPEALDVAKAWGFTYKASFVWDKIKHNMGHYNSVRHEFLLVCVKGSCMPEVKKLYDSVVSVERGQHSEKPEIFREIIDTLYPRPDDRINRVELFGREKVEGWDYHGNEFK